MSSGILRPILRIVTSKDHSEWSAVGKMRRQAQQDRKHLNSDLRMVNLKVQVFDQKGNFHGYAVSLLDPQALHVKEWYLKPSAHSHTFAMIEDLCESARKMGKETIRITANQSYEQALKYIGFKKQDTTNIFCAWLGL